MASSYRSANGRGSTTEQGLRLVATNYVFFLSETGHEASSIRRSVMQVASRVIQSLAANEYQAETHIAVVQRTIDAVLDQLGMVEEPRQGEPVQGRSGHTAT